MTQHTTQKKRTVGAILYSRVSTGEQVKHGTSLESQRDACRAKAYELGLPIVAEYDDGGMSGGLLLARVGFQAALADLAAGYADTLICPNISRYSRDVEHQQAVKKAVKAAGGRLIFCDMEFADTTEGDLNFTIQGGFAEYERKVIRARSIKGHRKRAESGVQTARMIPPYGYTIPTKADVLRGTAPAEDLGKYLLIDAEAAVVRQLFDRYAGGGESLTTLTRRLNAEGVPTPGGARLWGISTLRYLLANPVYKGLASYGRSDWATDETRLGQIDPRTGKMLRTLKTRRAADPETWITWTVPALVSEAVWDTVQATLAANRVEKAGNPKQVRMLSGRVHCPECGAGMTCHSYGAHRRVDGTRSESIPRYICTRYRQTLTSTGKGECVPDAFSVPDVEAAVLLAVLEAATRPESVQAALATYVQAQSSRTLLAQTKAADPRRELAALDQALEDWKTRQAATVKAQIAGIMAGADPNAYATLFGELAEERKDLEDRRGVLSRRVQGAKEAGQGKETKATPDFAALLEHARGVLTAPDMPGAVKRDILGTIIEQVICRKTETGKTKKAGAEIVFRAGVFPATPLQANADNAPGENTSASILQKTKQISRPSLP